MDMAGFAVSLKLVLANPDACFDGAAPMGFLESSFLKGLVTMDELEPKADNCSKVRAFTRSFPVLQPIFELFCVCAVCVS